MDSTLRFQTINCIRFSDGTSFYSMRAHDRYVPLVRYGEAFFPVNEHHLRIIFVLKLIAIAELRTEKKQLNYSLSSANIRGLVAGDHLASPSGLGWWPSLVFEDNEEATTCGLKHGREELKRLMSEH